MGNIYLCVGKYAETPFYICDAGIHIYSMEELCYYMMDNIHMLDEQLMSSELITWIAEECQLPELAGQLKEYARRNVRAHIFVSKILEYTHYCSDEKRQDMERILQASMSMSDFQKRKLKADYCFRNKHYEKALNMYLQLLAETNRNDFMMAAKLYHNIGTIYAENFLMEKAADAFLLAYQIDGSIESRRALITVKQMQLSEGAYHTFRDSYPEWETDFRWVEVNLQHTLEKWELSDEKHTLERMIPQSGGKRASDYYQNVDDYLTQKKEHYRMQNE